MLACWVNGKLWIYFLKWKCDFAKKQTFSFQAVSDAFLIVFFRRRCRHIALLLVPQFLFNPPLML